MAKFFAYLIGWSIQILILAGFFYLFMFINDTIEEQVAMLLQTLQWYH